MMQSFRRNAARAGTALGATDLVHHAVYGVAAAAVCSGLRRFEEA